jgi:hypothetical protein
LLAALAAAAAAGCSGLPNERTFPDAAPNAGGGASGGDPSGGMSGARDAGHDQATVGTDAGADHGSDRGAGGADAVSDADPCGPGPVGSAPWSEVTAPPELADAGINDVWAAGPQDLFVVGSVYQGGGVGTPELWTSHLMHWNAANGWRDELVVPVFLRSVSGTAVADAWAVADSNVYHRDGIGWESVALPPEAPAPGLRKVQAMSATDVWFLGTSSLIHLQGSDWSSFQLLQPDPTGLSTRWFGTFWVEGPNDLWMSVDTEWVGSTMPPVFLAHFDGAALTLDPAFLWIATVSSMWGADGSGFWFTEPGFYEFSDGEYRIPALRRHDGTATTSDVFIAGTIDPEHSVDLTAVWGAASDDVWAVGSSGYPIQGVVSHFDGLCWRLVTNAPAADQHNLVTGEASSVWIVSDGPRFFRLAPR